jgi:hypothetical protein
MIRRGPIDPHALSRLERIAQALNVSTETFTHPGPLASNVEAEDDLDTMVDALSRNFRAIESPDLRRIILRLVESLRVNR